MNEHERIETLRKKYGIPDVPYLPAGERVIVWRLPSEEKTAGGLYIPEAHGDLKSRGILLAAGLAARDVLADALIAIGDEVYFGKYAGTERQVERRESEKTPKILEMMVQDLGGSVEAVLIGDDEAVIDPETREHTYVERKPIRIRKGA